MSALIGERQKQQAEREKALDAERTRAAELAKQADSLKDLIAQLEQGLDPATRAAREAAIREATPPGAGCLARSRPARPGGRFCLAARAYSDSG